VGVDAYLRPQGGPGCSTRNAPLTPIDWRLFMPAEWDGDPRRDACQVPKEVVHGPKWKLALAMIDELRRWGLKPPVVVGDAAYGDITELRVGLAERDVAYVLDVKGPTRHCRRARSRSTPSGPARAARLRRANAVRSTHSPACARRRRGGLRGDRLTRWDPGGRCARASWSCACAPPMSSCAAPTPAAASCRCAGCWPSGRRLIGPTDFWLSNLPAETPIEELVCLAKLRWGVEQDYRELKDALGLDQFEGRSYPGWKHHVSLVSVAHGSLTAERLRRPRLRAAA
jgi:SRSO17 transposase